MHVAFLTPEYPTPFKPEGGLGNYIRKVSLELIDRGHKVSVFVLTNKRGEEIDQGIHLFFIKRMRFHWRLHRSESFNPWLSMCEDRINSTRLKKAVLKLNSKEKIDILQSPNYKAPGLALCHNGKFPLICRCSSYQPLWRSSNGLLKHLPDTYSDWRETRQLTNADAAFSPSKFIMRTYESFEAIKPVIIRTPIDLSPIEMDESKYSELLSGKKYLLFFGALNGVKGVDILIRALPGALSAHKELDIVLIGRNDPLPDGTRALETIQKYLAEYLHQNRVHCIPSIPRSQLYPIISHAFGVVMPSRVDNYPNACLEALSLGVPVIGTYDSSLDEMIEDGKTGFLAKNGDTLSLQQAIEKLLSLSSDQRNEMVHNIQAEIERIQKEDRVGQLIEFYEGIIDRFQQRK